MDEASSCPSSCPSSQNTGIGGAPSESDVLKAIVSHPSLLERPIFVSGERAVVGRPPETVLTLLGGS